jgi:hypothetical protein
MVGFARKIPRKEPVRSNWALSYHIGRRLPKTRLAEVQRERLDSLICQHATDEAARKARFDFKRQ